MYIENNPPPPNTHTHFGCYKMFLNVAVYQVIRGTLEVAHMSDVEWVYRPFMNTAKKRKFLAE